jgi:hypothetical protein
MRDHQRASIEKDSRARVADGRKLHRVVSASIGIELSLHLPVPIPALEPVASTHASI